MVAPVTRRTLLKLGATAGAAASLPFTVAARSAGSGLLLPGDPPTTGFEDRGGASWTTHEEELAFLGTIAAERSDRLRLEVLDTLPSGRPLHLAVLGAPVTRGEVAKATPTVLVVGSQHGNEPAGREAALKLIRDLAYGTDPKVLAQLERQTILVIPSANPDGRAANSRGNANGIDINRDHLGMRTREAQAMARVIRDWAPSLALDLHEYGPSLPVLYDDDILYLWPRNLNVDTAVQDAARSFCLQYVKKDAEAAGYTADEYGLYKVGPNVGPVAVPVDAEITQTAGDGDEGICRNAVGLRHVMGVLIESAVSQNPKNGAQDLTTAGLQSRRVASQMVVLASTLRFMREQGEAAKAVTDGAPGRKAREGAERSAPLFFNGADNRAPTSFASPPPSGYRLTAAQADAEALTMDLHGISRTVEPGGTVRVSMAQHAEPAIGLLFDARGARRVVAGQALDD
ncbi:MAG: M14 family metallocarboxypeptidase [Actinomycetes bacterium]